MSRAAGSARAVSEARLAVPEGLLDEGEVVILAVRPSAWFVVLVSWPVVVLSALVAAGGVLVGHLVYLEPTWRAVPAIALGVVGLRLILGTLQWGGRWYILTNRRVLRTSGRLGGEVFQCPLKEVQNTLLVAGFGEKPLGLRTLLFNVKGRNADAGWVNLLQADQIQQVVEETLRQIR